MDADFVPSDEGDGEDEFDLDEASGDDNEEEMQDFEAIMNRIRRNEGFEADDDDDDDDDGEEEEEEEEEDGDDEEGPGQGAGMSRGPFDVQPGARGERRPTITCYPVSYRVSRCQTSSTIADPSHIFRASCFTLPSRQTHWQR